MFKIISVLLTMVILFVFGCASIVSKSNYPVSINSFPEGATITIKDKKGMPIYKGKTPTTVTLKSGAGFFSGASYAVTFEKSGYEAQTMFIEKELDGWYIGNFLFGGLIGLLIVDPATGAMWKLPDNITATLAEKTSSLIIDGKELKIAFLDDIPAHLRSQMVRIK
ncbi:MAG: PEGA domain-containing protein [Deferribacteres bacterium]|nr:PEGA domain-containing protein [Deferribacteres bacterium]